MPEPRSKAEPKLDRRVIRSKTAVLAAGVELYRERGSRAITVEEIARRTGIAKTTIYRHWHSREDLILEILEKTAVELPTVETNNPVEDIRTIVLSLWTDLVLPTSRTELAGTIEALATDPELSSRHRDFLAARSAPLVDAVTRAVDAGAIETDSPPQTLAALLASPIIVRALIRGDEPDGGYVDHLMEIVLDTPRADHPRRRKR